MVLLNAAYALYAAEKVPNVSAGIALAKKMIDSGQAYRKLEELKSFTRKFR
ncbi:MAG TPA: hypothetical protein PKV41_03825 [Candidatus Omnitrophota bacterium]|nr:hypothetical protein [Candidatus Omnitrophota bacterium]